MPTEADTCRTLITPKLQAAGWENDPHSIAEQRTFTDGRIIVRGNRAERRKGKRADYILRYTRDFPIAVVEAKPEDEPAATGLQQSKDYAEILKKTDRFGKTIVFCGDPVHACATTTASSPRGMVIGLKNISRTL